MLEKVAKALALVSHLILGLAAIGALTVLAFKGIIPSVAIVPAILTSAGLMTGGGLAIQKAEHDALMQKPPEPENKGDHHA